MIDESQLLFMEAASETFKQTADVQLMWEVLWSLIKSAKYVRCYDGFLGRTTYDVLRPGLNGSEKVLNRVASLPT